MSTQEIKIITKTLRLNIFKFIKKILKMTNVTRDYRLCQAFYHYVEELEDKYSNLFQSNGVQIDAFFAIKTLLKIVAEIDNCYSSSEYDNYYKQITRVFKNDVNFRGNLNCDELTQVNNYLVDVLK